MGQNLSCLLFVHDSAESSINNIKKLGLIALLSQKFARKKMRRSSKMARFRLEAVM